MGWGYLPPLARPITFVSTSVEARAHPYGTSTLFNTRTVNCNYYGSYPKDVGQYVSISESALPGGVDIQE